MIQIVLGVVLLLAAGQSINFFSPNQDVEIGSESAREAERSFSLVSTRSLAHRHVSTIARRVTQNRSLPALKYQFRIVNSEDINSVGFPGGAIYLNRGLLDIASTDDEIAAMLAHEVSHVASRHGTVQLSRQLLVQAPIAIAAGVPASQVWKDEITKLGITLGMDAPFLRYTREQELEAGLMAVRLLAEARYDPIAFRTFLEKINEAQSPDAPRARGFAFNHPQSQVFLPLEIAEQIEQLAASSPRARAGTEFRAFRSALSRLPAPPDKAAAGTEPETPGVLSEAFAHPMDFYQLGYPTGWQVTRTGPHGAIIAPMDGVQSSRNRDDVSHGVMFDLFDISATERPLTLEQATNRLIAFLRQRNQPPADPRFVDMRVSTSWLRIVPGAQTQTLVSDEPGLRTVMIGKPDTNSQTEVAWIITRLYYQSLFFIVCVAPEDEFPLYQPIFEQMIRSVRFR